MLPWMSSSGRANRGLLEPSIQNSTDSGSPNLFTWRDAVTARIFADLRRSGVGLEVLGRTREELNRHSDQLGGDQVIVINGHVSIHSAKEQISVALKGREPAALYCVGWALDAVHAKLARA